ncbi:MAG: hypothetical protein ACI4QD_04245 [Kiritimatiellia bacterium]
MTISIEANAIHASATNLMFRALRIRLPLPVTEFFHDLELEAHTIPFWSFMSPVFLSEFEKQVTTYHNAGQTPNHALFILFFPSVLPVSLFYFKSEGESVQPH